MTKTFDARQDLIGRLGPPERLRAFVRNVDVATDAASSSRVLRWTPRRSCFSVRAANQRSTRFIQEPRPMRLENPALLSEGRICNEKTHGVLTASSGQDTKADNETTIGSKDGAD